MTNKEEEIAYVRNNKEEEIAYVRNFEKKISTQIWFILFFKYIILIDNRY
jgi:hypothetical protein